VDRRHLAKERGKSAGCSKKRGNENQKPAGEWVDGESFAGVGEHSVSIDRTLTIDYQFVPFQVRRLLGSIANNPVSSK